jgi:hypothetical protein
MYLFLLKKALPFTLTFIFGAVLSGLMGLFGSPEKKAESFLSTRTYDFKRGCDSRMRRRHLVAETKPLAILSTPDAWLPRGAVSGKGAEPVALVRVTFGADGKVQDVTPLTSSFRTRDDNLVELKVTWETVEEAARRIRFTPETVNSLPVTVTKDVEIRLRSH